MTVALRFKRSFDLSVEGAAWFDDEAQRTMLQAADDLALAFLEGNEGELMSAAQRYRVALDLYLEINTRRAIASADEFELRLTKIYAERYELPETRSLITAYRDEHPDPDRLLVVDGGGERASEGPRVELQILNGGV